MGPARERPPFARRPEEDVVSILGRSPEEVSQIRCGFGNGGGAKRRGRERFLSVFRFSSEHDETTKGGLGELGEVD
ncbi:MAG: hypothetical protein KJ053_05300 [Dehalococcoidia bacterium]|nr:hypothetical protein [Dehalococcoidia bacterium]